jgi:FG-GAP-like repeat
MSLVHLPALLWQRLVTILLVVAFMSVQASARGFQVAQSFPGGVAGDFNGDGKQDIAFASSNGVSVQFGNGDGTFQAAVNSAPGWSPAASGDFNNDGKLDLVAWNGTGLAILLGNGDGTFQTPALSYGAVAGQIAIGDFNGDGKLDVVTSGGSVFLGNGNGTLQPISTLFSPVGTGIAVGDFNGDGKADLVVPDPDPRRTRCFRRWNSAGRLDQGG